MTYLSNLASMTYLSNLASIGLIGSVTIQWYYAESSGLAALGLGFALVAFVGALGTRLETISGPARPQSEEAAQQ